MSFYFCHENTELLTSHLSNSGRSQQRHSKRACLAPLGTAGLRRKKHLMFISILLSSPHLSLQDCCCLHCLLLFSRAAREWGPAVFSFFVARLQEPERKRRHNNDFFTGSQWCQAILLINNLQQQRYLTDPHSLPETLHTPSGYWNFM